MALESGVEAPVLGLVEGESSVHGHTGVIWRGRPSLEVSELHTKDVSPFPGSLVDRWADFVMPARRLHTLLPFLERLIPSSPDACVLDLAAGIGCDSVALAAQGHRVVANEYCPHFRSLLKQLAVGSRVGLEITSLDWLQLNLSLPTRAFDLVYLVGNSFCLLMGAEERRAAAQQFADLLVRGGRLVVDERNFRYITDQRTDILEGRFRYGGNVLYCGSAISGRPTAISPQHVEFTYFDNRSGAVVGELPMYPFGTGELVDIFERVGLCQSGMWSDLRPGFEAGADFYTYVLTRYW